MRASRPVRYLVNGTVSACVHFAVLNVGIHLLHLPSAGLANFIAALMGISVSFLGNRYFVFRAAQEPIWSQLARFWLLYGALATMQGVVMYAWADVAGLDYRLGFLIGTFIQVSCSYLGGKHWVFKP